MKTFITNVIMAGLAIANTVQDPVDPTLVALIVTAVNGIIAIIRYQSLGGKK